MTTPARALTAVLAVLVAAIGVAALVPSPVRATVRDQLGLSLTRHQQAYAELAFTDPTALTACTATGGTDGTDGTDGAGSGTLRLPVTVTAHGSAAGDHRVVFTVTRLPGGAVIDRAVVDITAPDGVRVPVARTLRLPAGAAGTGYRVRVRLPDAPRSPRLTVRCRAGATR